MLCDGMTNLFLKSFEVDSDGITVRDRVKQPRGADHFSEKVGKFSHNAKTEIFVRQFPSEFCDNFSINITNSVGILLEI